MEQRKRKLQFEIDEVLKRQQDDKREFERTKLETLQSIEHDEGETHTQAMRESRNRQIEAEVETRRVKQERERMATLILADEREFQSKMDDLSRLKRSLHQ